MGVPFENSPNLTIGIELEMLIIDPQKQKTVAKSPQIIKKMHEEGHSRIKCEFNQSTIELESPISSTVSSCRSAIESDLKILRDCLAEEELSLIATGTHPFTSWMEMEFYPAERYHTIFNKMQILAKRMHVYGLHVHIGVASGEEAIGAINRSIQYIPYLLALSANSPFWNGIDTGLESFRYSVINSFPYAGIPPYFLNWEKFSEFFFLLQTRKVIKKMKDVYWHVRPSPDWGTVEFRICDIPSTLDEIMALTALVQCIVIQSLHEYKSDPAKGNYQTIYTLLPENMMMAQRYGLEGPICIGDALERISIREGLTNLLERLTPIAADYKCLEELNFIHEMMAIGNGALRQRRCFKHKNSLNEVVRMLENEFMTGKALIY